MASLTSVFTKLLLFFSFFKHYDQQIPGIPDSTIALQNMNGVCSSIWNPATRQLKDRDYYVVVSHTAEQDFYASDRNCVVTLIGKTGYQWEITINTFDVEAITGPGGTVIKCPDFLKIYDSERCDNAKLLKGINFKTGLCGTLDESSVGTLIFTSCSNKVTVQFKTDIKNSFQRGFSMALRQYPWRNPTGGPDCDPDLNGLAVGVWRDGTFSEFQHTWNEQPVIPGYIAGGSENDYDKEIGGIQCYECQNCPVEPFDPERDGTAVSANCFTCSKEWDEEYQSARRKCYSRTEFNNFILSIEAWNLGSLPSTQPPRDKHLFEVLLVLKCDVWLTSAGPNLYCREIESPFLGCRAIANEWGRTVNYCFCDTDKCNTGTVVIVNHTGLLLSLIGCAIIKYFLYN